MNLAKGFLVFLTTALVLLGIGFLGYFLFFSKKSTPSPPPNQPERKTENKDTETNPEVEDLSNIDPASVDSDIQENLTLATEKALLWRPDAVLVCVQVKLDSLEPYGGMETYVFDSPSVPNLHFTFTISQKSKQFIRAAIPTEDYLGSGLLPIDKQYWKLNYVSALQIAEKEGGKDFRDRYLYWTVELNLKRGEPKNWLYWDVKYQERGGDSLSVRINPYTGEVVK